MENRNGLLVDLQISPATGYAEREVTLEMLQVQRRRTGRVTVGADRGYDTRDFVAAWREQGVTPDVAQHQNARRRSALDDRTTRHIGYEVSQRIRMRIEQVLGWTKVCGGLRKTRLRGVGRTQTAAYLVGAAYNLIGSSTYAGAPTERRREIASAISNQPPPGDRARARARARAREQASAC